MLRPPILVCGNAPSVRQRRQQASSLVFILSVLFYVILLVGARRWIEEWMAVRRLSTPCKYEGELYSGKVIASVDQSPGVVSTIPFLHVFMQFPSKVSRNRRREFFKALRCTLEHPAVLKVHLLQEDATTVYFHETFASKGRKSKVNIRLVGRRITYSDALHAVEEIEDGSFVLLTNADIYPGDGFDFPILNVSLMPGRGFALSRYEDATCTKIVRGRGVCDCRIYGNCHDSYVFRTPLPPSLQNITRFRFGGLWGSERVFIHALRQHGISLTNPCMFMKTHHVHCSQERPTQDPRDIFKDLQLEEESSRVPPLMSLPFN